MKMNEKRTRKTLKLDDSNSLLSTSDGFKVDSTLLMNAWGFYKTINVTKEQVQSYIVHIDSLENTIRDRIILIRKYSIYKDISTNKAISYSKQIEHKLAIKYYNKYRDALTSIELLDIIDKANILLYSIVDNSILDNIETSTKGFKVEDYLNYYNSNMYVKEHITVKELDIELATLGGTK